MVSGLLDYWTEIVKQLPQDGTPLTQGGNSSFRLLRGGSWVSDAWDCRSACRDHDFAPDIRYGNDGFRVVCRSSRTL